MAISIAFLGSAQGAVTTHNITTGANIVAGDMVLVIIYSGTSSTGLASITTDASGNVYTVPSGQSTSSNGLNYGFCLNAAALSSGATLTINYGGAAANHVASAYRISGMRTTLPIVDTPAFEGNTATAASCSLTWPRFNQNSDISFMALVTNTNNPGTFTPGGSWTNLGGSQATRFMQIAYLITTDQASITASPTWQNSVSGRLSYIPSFRGAVSASHDYSGLLGVTC